MDQQEKAKRIKALLEQIAPGQSLETVHVPEVPIPQARTAAGGLEVARAPAAPPVAAETLNSAIDKLAAGRHADLTPAEMFGLEAIVLPQNRPVVFVRGGTYDDIGAPWTDLNAAAVRTRINPLLPLIGRIELPTSPILPYAGTGFIVGDGLIATNRHVAQIFAQGLGMTIRYRSGDAAVDFKKEVDTPDTDTSARLQVRGVELIHPFWDMALLRVDGLPSGKALKLSTRTPEQIGRAHV